MEHGANKAVGSRRRSSLDALNTPYVANKNTVTGTTAMLRCAGRHGGGRGGRWLGNRRAAPVGPKCRVRHTRTCTTATELFINTSLSFHHIVQCHSALPWSIRPSSAVASVRAKARYTNISVCTRYGRGGRPRQVAGCGGHHEPCHASPRPPPSNTACARQYNGCVWNGCL